MKLEKKMELLAEALELDVDDFSPETELDALDEWDSLAAISYVVMMDEQFNVVVNPSKVREFKTIQDILDSMDEK